MKKNTKNTNINDGQLMMFSAVDPYMTTNIVQPVEKEIRGYDFISWGEQNQYPEYLLSLYKDVPTLHTLINAAADYVCGDDAIISKSPFDIQVNDRGETINSLLRRIIIDWWIYGAFAINVVRNKLGGIAGLYYVNVQNIRSDKKNERFFYAEDWGKSYGRVKAVEYPRYELDGKSPSSIVYVKNNYNTTYGIPQYGPAVKAAELLKAVDEYQLNAINNNFVASYIISFNNGQPSPEVAQEIEDELNEKFSGYQNAGRLLVCYNKDKDHEVTVQKLEQPEVGERYKSLIEWAQSQIFTSFRCAPQLCGINAEKTGFNDSDYNESYKLFSRTVILPVQRLVCDTFKKIFGEDVLVIKPFTIDFTEEGDEKEIVS